MSDDRFQHLVDGAEIEEEDINLFATSAALADDRAWQELLVLAPPASVVAKGIIPYAYGATVIPNGASSTVKVMPFKALLGSRTATGTSALESIRNVRSAQFIGSNPLAFGQSVSIATNGSGNPRIDLVYLAFTPDANGASRTRNVRPPGGGAPAATSVVTTLVQTLALGVVAGTAGATPSPPATPADAAGTYYIPLTYIRVPGSMGGTHTFLSTYILGIAPVVSIDRHTGVVNFAPPNKLSNALPTGTIQAWGATGARPTYWMPPSWNGAESFLVGVNLQDASSANWSHASGAILDDSRDWRNRVFKWTCMVITGATRSFAWDKAAATAVNVPSNRTQTTYAPPNDKWFGVGQSFQGDDLSDANLAMVAFIDHNAPTDVASGASIRLTVNMTTGALQLLVSGTPAVRAFFWLDASGPFPNF